MKTCLGQPPTLAQLPAQQRKIRRKFEYFLAGWAIASNEDMTQVGYCLGLKSSARPRGCSWNIFANMALMLSPEGCWRAIRSFVGRKEYLGVGCTGSAGDEPDPEGCEPG